MSEHPIPKFAFPAERGHSRGQAVLFLGKAWIFRAQRLLREAMGKRPRRFPREARSTNETVLAESHAELYLSVLPAEFALQAGKVQNLRVAAARLDGLVIPAGGEFSFWAHVGRPVRGKGFVEGRELREGCIVPSVGGGLCQLSNALYDAALRAGFAITERHEHSRRLPGSMAEAGRDATVFWNYVDLRFRPPVACLLETRLTRSELIVRFRAVAATTCADAVSFPATSSARESEQLPAQPQPPAGTVESCETCGIASCFRHIETGSGPSHGVTAWLVDAWWPEFDAYLRAHRQRGDWLCAPLHSARLHVGPYRWDSAGFARVRQAPWEVLHRSLVSRRLAAQGAARQRALLRFDEALARRYSRMLPPEATHLVVSQNLLPFLWRNGALGGRTFDVLMTRLPLAALEATLDRAHASHPRSRTLADFRADPVLLAEESAALAEARHWITPHSAIARLAGPRAVKLAWQLPHATLRVAGGKDIVFPASTLGRKGAYELREAAQELGLRVTLGGPVIEDAAFWRGVETVAAGDAWLPQAAAVVLPAWVENQSRRLLQAVAAGIPVIASHACGLDGMPGVTVIPAGDAEALTAALAALLLLDPAIP